MQVRPERNGWRDEALSRRHRLWGWDCPAVDIDFLMLEYDSGAPVAMIEYKSEHAAPITLGHPSIKALRGLANASRLPFIIVRYGNNLESWRVFAANSFAVSRLNLDYPPAQRVLSEEQYVELLYGLRGRSVPRDVRLAIGSVAA